MNNNHAQSRAFATYFTHLVTGGRDIHVHVLAGHLVAADNGWGNTERN
jgi:hypothetical protein